MKFKRSYSKARNLGSAYKFAFGGDINRANNECVNVNPYMKLVKYNAGVCDNTIDEKGFTVTNSNG